MKMKVRNRINWVKRFVKLGIALATNRARIRSFINRVIDFENRQLRIQSWNGKFRSFKRMTKAVVNGEYKRISPWLFVNTAIGVMYVVSNSDLIPDKLYKLGLLDDIAVVFWVLQNFSNEIEKFELWEVEEQIKQIQFA